MRFARCDVRGPHRFTQEQSATFVSALRSVAAIETAKNQLSRDFRCGSILDFFNSIGTFETCRPALRVSVPGGDRKSSAHGQTDANDPERT
jgi:hypothetical protein